MSVGFSDDDPVNVHAVAKFISNELAAKFRLLNLWFTTPPTQTSRTDTRSPSPANWI